MPYCNLWTLQKPGRPSLSLLSLSLLSLSLLSLSCYCRIGNTLVHHTNWYSIFSLIRFSNMTRSTLLSWPRPRTAIVLQFGHSFVFPDLRIITIYSQLRCICCKIVYLFNWTEEKTIRKIIAIFSVQIDNLGVLCMAIIRAIKSRLSCIDAKATMT